MVHLCRPLRGLGHMFFTRSWGWRPRLYACARFAGLKPAPLRGLETLRPLRALEIYER